MTNDWYGLRKVPTRQAMKMLRQRGKVALRILRGEPTVYKMSIRVGPNAAEFRESGTPSVELRDTTIYNESGA